MHMTLEKILATGRDLNRLHDVLSKNWHIVSQAKLAKELRRHAECLEAMAKQAEYGDK
jgi:hypothetical protein